MAGGEFGVGPDPASLPYGWVDVVQPFEVPEEYDAKRRRKAEKTVGDLADSMRLRYALTEDLAKRPGSYLIRLQGKESNVNDFRAKLSSITID